MVEAQSYQRWKVVVLSLIAAGIFWFFSALGREYSYRFNYPIDFVYNEDSLVAVKNLPEFVDIDVTGGGWDLFRETFWIGGSAIVFDLENPVTTRYLTRSAILPILTEQIGQFRVNFLFTDTLWIHIDRRDSSLVQLTVDSLQIDMDTNHRIVSSISLSPDTAMIFGPKSFLDTLKRFLTVKLDARQIDESFDRYVELGLPERFGIYAKPASTKIQFEVERFEQLEIVTQVELLGFPEDSSIYIENPNIAVQMLIQESLKQDYYESDFNVIVDHRMINPNDSMAPIIIISHPEEAMELTTVPDSLKVIYAQ